MRWTKLGLRDREETENKVLTLHKIVTIVAEGWFFFKIIFINAYLSVIFASIFSVMINSFLLSAADIFRMCQTRYLNSSLFIQFFLPAFTVVKVLRAM